MPAYVPPANFGEFFQRYPKVVPNYLRSKWRGIATDELETDVFIHLMALPDDSKHTGRVPDPIGTFDAGKCGGRNAEGLFLNYVCCTLVDNFLGHGHAKAKRRKLQGFRELPISSLPYDQEAPDDESALGTHGHAHRPQQFAKVFFDEFVEQAYRIHPLLGHAALALPECGTYRELHEFLEVSEDQGLRAVAALRSLARGITQMRRGIVDRDGCRRG